MKTEARRRWALAVAGTVIVGLGVVALFQPLPEPKVASSATSSPRLAKSDISLSHGTQGEAALLDKTSLFMPTEWNTAQKKVTLPKSGGVFADYAMKPAFDEAELRPLQPKPKSDLTSADLVSLTPPGAVWQGFGRNAVKLDTLSKRDAMIEVAEARSGQRVLTEVVSGVLKTPNPVDLWRPIEFLAVVDARGLSGPLVLTKKSGMDELDAFFQKYLTKEAQIGVRLNPGVYRINVGP